MAKLGTREEHAVDATEAKKQRKEAKREAAAAAAAAAEAEAEAEAKKAKKRLLKRIMNEDPEEAKKQRKAAKRKAKEDLASSEAAALAESETPAAKPDRKAAKLAATEDVLLEQKAEASNGTGENDSLHGTTQGKGQGKGKQTKEFEVFVGGLPPSAADEDVVAHFKNCGTIRGLNMLRGTDGKHKGKAFLEFDSKAACHFALQMNKTLYGSCPNPLVIRMASDGRAVASSAIEVDKWRKDLEVVIGGLPFSMTEDEVREHFAGCGKIVGLRMPPHLRKKGVAFIAFSCRQACEKALSFHGTSCAGRPLFVHMQSNGSAPHQGDSKDKALLLVKQDLGSKEFEVFVGGLPFETTKEILQKDFAECGDLVACRMIVKDDGTCKGGAFLEYKDKESCDKVMAFDGTEYGGRTIRVRMSGADSTSGKGDKGEGKGKGKAGKGKGIKANKELEITIYGLPFSATKGVLMKDFQECGDIVRLVLPLNEEGQAKGNAYIEFANKAECEKALAFNDTEYGGRWIRVRMSLDRNDAGAVAAVKGTDASLEVQKKDASLEVPKASAVTFDSDDE